MCQTINRREIMDSLIKDQVVQTVLGMIHDNITLTMDEIAIRSCLAKGTLYNYFKNKRELLAFVHQMLISPLKEGARKIYAPDISPMEMIANFVNSVFDFHREYPLYFKIIQGQRTAAVALEEKISLAVTPLVKVCKDGIAQGLFVDLDPYVLAAMIFGTVVGSMESLPYRNEPAPDMDSLKKDILSSLGRSLLKAKELQA